MTAIGYEATIDADYGPHFEAIGRLVVEFARADAYVHLLAERVSGLGTTKGMVVFHGMRLPDLVDRIRGLLRLSNFDQASIADLESCLAQLDVISKQRHKLAHRFVDTHQEGVSAHSLYTSKTLGSGEVDLFTPAELKAMAEDCYKIRVRIYRHTDGEGRRKTRSLDKYLFEPWLYKPPRSKAHNKSRHRTSE